MLKDIIEVKHINNYKLYLRFEDDKDGIVDISQIIKFTVIFEPFNNLEYFKTVKLNLEWGTIYWDNGADLDPDVLYSLITDKEIPNYQTNIEARQT